MASLNAFWDWRLGSRTTFHLGYLTSRQDNGTDQADSEITNYTASLSRSFGSSWSGDLSYTNIQQETDGDGEGDYEENRLQVGVRGEF